MPTVESPTSPQPRPDVAVILPCYNYGRFLTTCVRSVLDATLLDVQVIIVDDASTDDTAAVCAGLASTDPRIVVVRHEKNLGHVATYNHGLDLASAEYVHLISADDEFAPFALDRAVAIMRRHPDVGMVYGRVARMFTSRRPHVQTPRCALYSIVRGADWINARCRDGRNPIFSPEVTLRHSVAAETGPYESRLPDLGDLEMWLRTAARTNVAIIENAHQAVYRTHGQNMNLASSRTDGFVRGLRQRLAAFELFFEKDGHLLPNVDELKTIVRRRVAHDALSRAQLDFDGTSATRETLLESMEFATSIAAEAQRTREWRCAERLFRRQESGYWLFPGRLRRRISRWWQWQMNNRDIGHRGVRRIYRGRVCAPSRVTLSKTLSGLPVSRHEMENHRVSASA